MDWKQELLKRLDAVAAKLGTTTEYLWKVLVKQGYVEGIAQLVSIPALLLLAYMGYRLSKKLYQMGEDDGWNGPGPVFGSAFLYLGIGAAIFLAMGNAYFGLLQLLNPEYFALRQILQAIK